MKIALVVGHTPYSKGAFSEYFNSSEFDFYNSHFERLNEIGDVFIHDNDLGYTSRQKAMASKTRDYDVVFEIHFNASNGSAQGCEALYYHRNETARKICFAFCQNYTDLTGVKNRGTKALNDAGDRGFGFVYNQKPTAIILEPFFGDNKKDCEMFNIDVFVDAIKYAVNNF
jgi:N-acetylmuramoyl-L-alanine amidase